MPETPSQANASGNKFTPPPLRKVLSREGLFSILDKIEAARAVWISGPAGGGKSTLAASYLAERKSRGIWYRIDSGDSDPATFFYCLGSAVDRAADVPRPRLPLLTPEYLLGMETFVNRFFEALGQRFQGPVWIVFDNLQEISAESGLMQVMRSLLRQIAPHIKICLISRNEPPPALAGALAGQDMITLGWPELAFSMAEYERVIQMFVPGVPAAPLAMRLHRQTRGWISGLILCLQQMPDGRVPAEMPEEHSRIFDYFASEILYTMMPERRSFLLQSSLLEEMSAEGAARMTGMERAADMLESFTEHNLFIEKLPGPVTTYRYHPLFRSFLRHYLANTISAAAMQNLCRRAASIMAESGSSNEAVKLYALARDWDGLAETILSRAPALTAQGRFKTLQAWLHLLPPACDQRPMLLFYQGMCRLANAPRDARSFFSEAFSKFVQQGELAGQLLSWSYIVESFLIARASTFGLSDWIREGERLHALLPRDDCSSLSVKFAQGMLTALTLGAPGHPHWVLWIERCNRALMHCPDPEQQLTMAHAVVLANCLRGELNEAAIVIEHFRSRSLSAELPATGRIILYLMESLFYSMNGETETCESKVREALEICSHWGIHVYDGLLYAFSTYAALGSERMQTARDNLTRIAAITPPGAMFDLAHFYCLSAWEAYIRGDLSRALALSQKGVACGDQSGWSMPILVAKVLQAKLLAECHQWQESERLILDALEASRSCGLVLAEFYGLLGLAEIRMLQGAFDAMREPLSKAFAISRLRGMMTGNWSLRIRLVELCQWALHFGIEAQQVLLFIRRHNLSPKFDQASEGWPFAVKFYFLGRRTILCHEKPMASSGKVPKRVFELLGLLISHGERGVRREAVADQLWPESDGDRAQQNINTTLHRLRKMLGKSQVISTKGGRLALSRRHCWVDTWCFEEAVSRAMSSDSAQRAEMLQKAISLYAGPPAVAVLPIAYAERLRRKFVRAVLEAGRLQLESGDPDAAVSVYQQALKIEETAEPVWQALLQAVAGNGQTAEALKLYRRFHEIMRLTSGIEPGAEIQALYRAIKQQALDGGGGIDTGPIKPAPRSPGDGNSPPDDR